MIKLDLEQKSLDKAFGLTDKESAKIVKDMNGLIKRSNGCSCLGEIQYILNKYLEFHEVLFALVYYSQQVGMNKMQGMMWERILKYKEQKRGPFALNGIKQG